MTSARDPGLDGVVPFRFACHRCGHCCSGGSGYVWLEEGEVEGLARALGATPERFAERHVRTARDPRSGTLRSALRETAGEGGRCTLLVGRNTCSAYHARPAHCRDFPYWPSVLTDRSAFEAARSTCPGIAVGVDETVRAASFAALESLYAALGEPREVDACCLAGERADGVWATALEADFALAAPPRRSDGCRLGDRRPTACRTADGESALARVRAIERAHAYPAAYAPLAALIASRGGAR